MPLIKSNPNSKSNMYDWITHRFNPVSGECSHKCVYCYMSRWGKQKPIHLKESEFKTNLGSGNFIFVCSGTDLFANDVPKEWIQRTLDYCFSFNNKYLFQSKNPERFFEFEFDYKNTVFCTTIETNRHYPEIMKKSPTPITRVAGMVSIKEPKYLTIEPIMDFDLKQFIELIHQCSPVQVNVGSDSGHNNLPEPPKEKVLELISELEKFTIVKIKKNLNRILNL